MIKLPGGAPAPARAAEPAPAPVVPAADPAPTPGAVGAADIQSVAVAVRRLALARRRDRLAGERLQQRDGLVRERARRDAGDAGHVGLRAAEPRAAPARPGSATDNVHAGVMYLKQLLDADRRRREHRDRRLLPGPRLGAATAACSTTRSSYVANVQALRSRFGG